MDHQRARTQPEQRDEPQLDAVENNQLGGDWYGVDEFELVLLPDDVWDVFELDDDTADPQPEPGDFWGEVENEEVIWAA